MNGQEASPLILVGRFLQLKQFIRLHGDLEAVHLLEQIFPSRDTYLLDMF
jgi:hypothetical protein